MVNISLKVVWKCVEFIKIPNSPNIHHENPPIKQKDIFLYDRRNAELKRLRKRREKYKQLEQNPKRKKERKREEKNKKKIPFWKKETKRVPQQNNKNTPPCTWVALFVVLKVA